jgi:putative effector of murein hydrolase
MIPAGLGWRDRLLLLNGVLFCVLGIALLTRYFVGQLSAVGAILGVAGLALGVYRLALARRELRRRASGSAGK